MSPKAGTIMAGIGFIVAGIGFVFSALLSRKPLFIVIGAMIVVLGAGFLSRAGTQKP